MDAVGLVDTGGLPGLPRCLGQMICVWWCPGEHQDQICTVALGGLNVMADQCITVEG